MSIIAQRKTHREYVNEVAQINPNLEVVEEYISANTKILHRCKIDGYEWKVRPSHILNGVGCPVCCGQTVLQGVNDLATLNPKVASEWDYEKNGDLLPTQVTHSSAKRVWWKCQHGHSWQVKITDRQRGEGCPECFKENKTSGAELKVYYYMKKYFSDAISSYSDKKNGLTELDIYIPSLNLGIEYDGQFYHKDPTKDKSKDFICETLGIKLIRIREPGCTRYNSSCYFMYLDDMKNKTLHKTIVNILYLLGVQRPDIDFDRDITEIEDLVFHNFIQNSLAECCPDIAAEWHPTKNGSLNPRNVKKKTTKLVWWLCPTCGNEYQSRVESRTNMGSGCPKCGLEKIAKATSIPVYCLELDCVLPSLAIAQRKTGATDISGCINNVRKSSGNHPLTNERLHWYPLYDKQQKNGIVTDGAITLRLIKEEDALEMLQLQ